MNPPQESDSFPNMSKIKLECDIPSERKIWRDDIVERCQHYGKDEYRDLKSELR
jgi:hypothetical protein